MLNYNPPLKVVPEKDAMFDQAVELIRSTGKASASFFQRHLQIGYARAASLLDEIESFGLIGPVVGAKPRPVLSEEEINPIKWNNFEIKIGKDKNNKVVKLDLGKYGNLLVIGSQFTSVVDFLNNVLVTSMATYSPDELRVIAIDGMGNDLIVPTDSPHLLTPKIVEGDKVVPALKWSVSEIERRIKIENISKLPKVLILINSMNLISMFSPDEFNDNLYRIMVTGRKHGVYIIIATDYPNPRTAKEIIANSPAKLVFKPTDKKVARETGVLESFELKSRDQAILESMYEGKTRVTITKVDCKKIYNEIYN